MLSTLHAGADRWLCHVENAAAVVAGCAIVTAMFLVSGDAILRHVFGAPLTFQLHLTEFYLLPSSIMLALAWGYRRGGAIQIKLLLAAIPDHLSRPIIRVGLAAASVYMAALAWRSWLVFARAWEKDEVVMGVINWPVAWSWIWIPLGCALLALRLALDATAPKLRPIGAAHQ